MRSVYSNRFIIERRPTDSRPATSVFDDVQTEIQSWISSRVQARLDRRVEIPSNGEVPLEDGGKIQVEGKGDGATNRIWSATYTHRDEDDDTRYWKTLAQLATNEAKVEFAIHVSAGTDEFDVRPERLFVKRPGIVKKLVTNYACSMGNAPILPRASYLREEDVSLFLSHTLFNPARKTPVLLAAPTARDEVITIDADGLADGLAGLAQVYVLSNHAATSALSDLLPSKLSVFDGGVRVYWPRMTMGDSHFLHPLWTRARLREMSRNGRPEDKLERTIIDLAADHAHQDGPVYRKVRTSLLNRHLEEYRQAIRNATTAKDFRAAAEKALEEIRNKEALLAEKEEYIAALEEENRVLQRRFIEYDVQRQRATADPRSSSPEGQQEEQPPSSVLESVERAAKQFPDILVIWPSALEGAASSHSTHAARVFETLEILAEVGQEYFKRSGRMGKPLVEVFAERNAPKYAPQDSDTTTQKFGHLRTFTSGTRRVQFKRHFTLGVGSRENCVQIYWEFDTAEQKVEVGYVGLHLEHADSHT